MRDIFHWLLHVGGWCFWVSVLAINLYRWYCWDLKRRCAEAMAYNARQVYKEKSDE